MGVSSSTIHICKERHETILQNLGEALELVKDLGTCVNLVYKQKNFKAADKEQSYISYQFKLEDFSQCGGVYYQ